MNVHTWNSERQEKSSIIREKSSELWPLISEHREKSLELDDQSSEHREKSWMLQPQRDNFRDLGADLQ